MPIVCPTPPDVPGSTPGEFAYLLFNKREVSVSPARMDGGFRDHAWIKFKVDRIRGIYLTCTLVYTTIGYEVFFHCQEGSQTAK